MNILIVDDQHSFRVMVRNELRQLGLSRISEVDDAAAALRTLQHQKFDLVLIDMGPQGRDGLGLLRDMRRNPSTAHIPVVIMAGETAGDAVAEAKQLHGVGVIARPFTMGGFAKYFSAIIARHAARKAAPVRTPSPAPQRAPTLAAAASSIDAFEID